MSIQNRNIVQIAVICNTLSPFHLAPDLGCRGEAPQARVSDLLWCYHSPEPGHWSGRGSLQSLITIHTLQSQQTGQLQESQHLLVSFIPSVTRRLSRCKHHTHPPHYPGHASLIRCDLVWDAGAVSDGWRLIFPGQRHTGGRGNGSPRLLMSRWGSAQTQSWSANIYWYSIQSICTINKKHTRSLNPHYLSLIFSKTKSFTKDESVS